MKFNTIWMVFVVILTSCAPLPSGELPDRPEVMIQPEQGQQAPHATDAKLIPTICIPEPIVAPTLPAVIPENLALDEATGLHMTGKPQVFDLEDYRLRVYGKVANELNLAYDELRCMPKVTDTPWLNCPGAFVDKAEWSGVPLDYVLDLAGIGEGATELWLTSGTGYKALVKLGDALEKGSFLAYELEGKTLPVIHGFPVRAVFPYEFGSKWVKWLVEIEVK